MRIDARYENVLSAVLMSLIMAFFMSLTMTLVNVGINEHFFLAWMNGLFIGFLVGIPASIVFSPIVRKAVHKLTAR